VYNQVKRSDLTKINVGETKLKGEIMSKRYEIKVIGGKINFGGGLQKDYIQMKDGSFQRLNKGWIEAAYEIAKEIGDDEAVKHLETVVVSIYKDYKYYDWSVIKRYQLRSFKPKEE